MMGRLIPAGTGFEYYRHVHIPPDEPPPPPPLVLARGAERGGGTPRAQRASRGAGDPDDPNEELELEREMEYFVEPEEAITRDEIE
jgi:hypothetical protein